MYCSRCGNYVNKPSKFCSRCGSLLSNEYSNNSNIKVKSQVSSASVAVGALSLTLVFIFQVFTIPLSVIGIILGVIGFTKTKSKTGLILNSVSFFLAVPLLLIYVFVFNPANDVIGTWNCKNFNNGYYEELDYVVTFKLNRDNSFSWSKYSDEENNHVYGDYELEKLNKTNGAGTAQYYSIILNGDEFVEDGNFQDEKYRSEYEMGLNKENNSEAVLMNVYSYRIYACFRER